MTTKKTALILDSQKMVFSHPLRKVYDFVKDIEQSAKFKRIPSKIKSLKKKYNNLIPLALDYKTSQELEKSGIEHKCHSEVTEQFLEFNSWNHTYKFMKRMDPVIKQIDPSMVHRGQLLWDLNQAEIWRFYAVPIIKTIEEAYKILDEGRYERVIIFDNTSSYQKAFALVAEQLNIEVVDKTRVYKKAKTGTEIRAIKLLAEKSARALLKTLGKKNKEKIEKKKDKKILVFYDHCETDKVTSWGKFLPDTYEKSCVGLDSEKEVKKEFQEAGFEYERLYNYASEPILKEQKTDKKQLGAVFKTLEKNKVFQHGFAYRNVPMWPVTKKLFAFLFYERFLETATRIELFNRMLDVEKPDMVICVDDWSRYPFTLLSITKQRGIKSAVVRYGMLDLRPEGVPMNGDKIMVYGETGKTALLNSGVSADKIEVTGQPEGKEENRVLETDKALAILGLDKSKPIIAFGGTCMPESATYHPYDIFYNTIKKNYQNAQVVSKMHPSENPTLQQVLVKKHGLNNIILTKKYLFELLTASSVLVTPGSTVANEAIAYGTPVIYINTLNAPEEILLKKNPGIVEVVYDEKQLESALKRILEKNRRTEIKNMSNEISKSSILQKGAVAGKAVVSVLKTMID
jgi:glycosyltransferase involved in cell wall biosynthesis